MARSILHVAKSTTKINQITGEHDPPGGPPFTLSRTETRGRLYGTDLGASIEHEGRLYFLFGDTWETANNARGYVANDGASIATSCTQSPDDGLELEFLRREDGRYLDIQIPGVTLRAFEVPSGGFSAGGKLYAFFTTDCVGLPDGEATMGRSLLACSADSGRTWTKLYNLSTRAFINVAPVVVRNADVPGVPRDSGYGVLMWASGAYRHSSPSLAWVPCNQVEQRDAIRYFAGVAAGTGKLLWSEREADAITLFTHNCVGELSVAYLSGLRRWLMTYNCGAQIVFRTSETPWGPWSGSATLFRQRDGLGEFMHTAGTDDGLGDRLPKDDKTGGPYGPYLIDRFTKHAGERTTIYYVMSTWNPYQAVLMRSELKLGPERGPRHPRGNPVLIQSSFGARGNLELITPLAGSGFEHRWRNNEHRPYGWSWPTRVGGGDDKPKIDAATFIQSNYGEPGNFELVLRAEDRLQLMWRIQRGEDEGWHGPEAMLVERKAVTGVSGAPCLVQASFGRRGNFELVTPLESGGLAHYWRDNDDPKQPWHHSANIGRGLGKVQAVSLIQSNYGRSGSGNLELVVVAGGALHLLWRDAEGWQGPAPLLVDGHPVRDVRGTPSLIQSSFGRKGNFELVVPRSSTGLLHLWRDNDSSPPLWHGPVVIGKSLGKVNAVSLIQSKLGGHLELVARAADDLHFMWRGDGPEFAWSRPKKLRT